MELAILVYAIDLLLKLVSFSEGFLLAMLGVSLVWIFVAGVASTEGDYTKEDAKRHFKKFYPYKTMFLAGFLLFLIPSPQTMKYIGAGYLVQSTFESEFVQETATLSQKAVIKQLKVWAEESPDIVPVLEELGVEVKEKALQEIDSVVKSATQTNNEGK